MKLREKYTVCEDLLSLNEVGYWMTEWNCTIVGKEPDRKLKTLLLSVLCNEEIIRPQTIFLFL